MFFLSNVDYTKSISKVGPGPRAKKEKGREVIPACVMEVERRIQNFSVGKI